MFCFRRLYSSLPDAAASARTASTPRAVRLRRRTPISQGKSDATPEGLTPTEFARYQRALAKGDLAGPDGRSLTEEEWLERLNDRRSRIRGLRKVVGKDGQADTKVVGQKIYLPNIIFRLVRNHTAPGQPYNPYEATFRVSQSVTKTDIRSYLLAVYGVKTTYIRTDNYFSPVGYLGRTHSHKTYKRAVVGLVSPFYYPQALDDMPQDERAQREKWLEEHLGVQNQQDLRKSEFLRITRSGSKDWRWRTGTTANRGNILRRIAEQRAAREDVILQAKNHMKELRDKGEAIV